MGTMDTAGAVLKFLRSVGPGADAEYYLREFRDGPRERFAAICVDAATMSEAADAVALDLRFLAELDLTPVVALGLGGATEGAQDAASLQASLDDEGVRAALLPADEPTAVRDAARNGIIPIVALGSGARHGAAQRLGLLLTHLGTHKLILLRSQGGLRRDGKRISVVNLSEEPDALRADPELAPGDAEALSLTERLVFELVPHPLLVAITSPINLLHELFTMRGAGTLLRRGCQIRRCDGLQGVDRTRLHALLETSFGRPILPALWQREFSDCYLEPDYRGAALLQAHPRWGYLSKFAVTRRAQGEGIGRDLWQAVVRDHPRLLWRSRDGNPIAPWYEARCDGRMRAGKWNVYFRGLSPQDLADAVAYATAQPDDLGRA